MQHYTRIVLLKYPFTDTGIPKNPKLVWRPSLTLWGLNDKHSCMCSWRQVRIFPVAIKKKKKKKGKAGNFLFI